VALSLIFGFMYIAKSTSSKKQQVLLCWWCGSR